MQDGSESGQTGNQVCRGGISVSSSHLLLLLSFPARPQLTKARLYACAPLSEFENTTPVEVLGTVLALKCDTGTWTLSATLAKNLILDLKACNRRNRPDGAPTHCKVRVTDETRRSTQTQVGKRKVGF